MSEIVVLKFGGTSLGTRSRIRTAALRVRAHQQRGRSPVVVVSANGNATDRIIKRLSGLCRSDAGTPATRESDRALATGEDLSSAILAFALTEVGVNSWSLRGGDAGITAAGPFGGAHVTRVDPSPLLNLIEQGIVPVVSGFQATRDDGELVTLGRGGSDISAVAIAAALGPAPCHIITDVDAVFDKDPVDDPEAVPFPELSHDALVAIARAGAAVVHPEAAELAREQQVPLRIYHYRDQLSGARGTRIMTAAHAVTMEVNR